MAVADGPEEVCLRVRRRRRGRGRRLTTLHVVRVFLGPGGSGGNPLGVFVAGGDVPADRRQAAAADLGYSETVFVDGVESGAARMRILTPGVELPFAGHPSVGTAWLLRHLGRPVRTLEVPAGRVLTWIEDGITWIRARPEWVYEVRFVEYATPGEVEDITPPPLRDQSLYAWAWEDAGIGVLRARYFPGEPAVLEDEATGGAALVLGARLGRPLVIRQGVGSELRVRPGADGSVDVGGRCALVEERQYPV